MCPIWRHLVVGFQSVRLASPSLTLRFRGYPRFQRRCSGAVAVRLLVSGGDETLYFCLGCVFPSSPAYFKADGGRGGLGGRGLDDTQTRSHSGPRLKPGRGVYTPHYEATDANKAEGN